MRPNVLPPDTVTRPCIAIAGCSGSGKTTLARALANGIKATFISADNYYYDLRHLPSNSRQCTNFDAPDAIESPLLIHHLQELRNGREIDMPVYDFKTQTRKRHIRLRSSTFIIVEGIFVLYWKSVRSQSLYRVYVDTPTDICIQRCTQRDAEERSRTPSEIVQRFHKHVLPMARKYVLPSRKFADICCDGTAPIYANVQQVVAGFGTTLQ